MSVLFITMGGQEQGWTRHNSMGIFRDYMAEALRLMTSAKEFGLETKIYDHNFITSPEYYPKYSKVLDRVSFGFAFKSMCLYDSLNRAKNGDIIIFVDSNHIIVQYPKSIIDSIIKEGHHVQDHLWLEYPNKQWTKRDTFVNMGCDTERYWNATHMQGNVVGFVKNDVNMNFVSEWKEYSLDCDVMFGNDEYENFSEFEQHRHDQSIYSILVEKYSLSYIKRREHVDWEYVIQELDGIAPEKIIDFSYRKEQDLKDNK